MLRPGFGCAAGGPRPAMVAAPSAPWALPALHAFQNGIPHPMIDGVPSSAMPFLLSPRTHEAAQQPLGVPAILGQGCSYLPSSPFQTPCTPQPPSPTPGSLSPLSPAPWWPSCRVQALLESGSFGLREGNEALNSGKQDSKIFRVKRNGFPFRPHFLGCVTWRKGD